MRMVVVEEVQELLAHRVHLHQGLQEVLHNKLVLEYLVLVVLEFMVELQEVDITLHPLQMVQVVVLCLEGQEVDLGVV
jgi:hypothetical protein